MPTIQAAGGGAVTATSTNNNGGNFIGGGTTSSANMDRSRLGKRGIDGQQFVATATSGAVKALSGGPLSSMTAGKYVIRRYCSELATVAKTQLQSGATPVKYRNSIHKIEAVRAAFVSAYTITAGDPQTVSYTRVTSQTTFANDEAARPSRSVPGEFVYRTGAPLPKQADYPAKTQG